MRKKLFWIISRSGLFLYARMPIFGALKGAMGVLRKNDTYLVIERNDGRGVSFPGGLMMPWENAADAVAREIREETGLRVTKSVFKFRYSSRVEIPVDVCVFEVEAEGTLRASWEGTPLWLPLAELRQKVIASQRRIVESLG